MDFHDSIIKEINSPLSLLAVEEKLELINLEDEIFEEEHASNLGVQKPSRIALNPELEEKMHSFIKDVLSKQEEYESNAIFYLINL